MGWFTLLSVTLGWFVSVGQDSKTRFGNLFEHSYSHATRAAPLVTLVAQKLLLILRKVNLM